MLASLFFGKVDLDDERQLRSRLQIKYPAEAFCRHFWANSRDFHAALKTHAAKLPEDPDRNRVTPERLTCPRDHSEWVNFDYIARTGTQASLDFFHLAPAGIARFADGKGSGGLAVTPVVRILTTVGELCRLLDACELVVNEIEPLLRVVETADE